MTALVCIGRNVGEIPMSTPRWLAFVADLNVMIETNQLVVINRCHGYGYWGDLSEDTYVVTLDATEADLVEGLAELAHRYEQEAIALLVGETQFIAALDPAALLLKRARAVVQRSKSNVV